jgi:hypothetical protein
MRTGAVEQEDPQTAKEKPDGELPGSRLTIIVVL